MSEETPPGITAAQLRTAVKSMTAEERTLLRGLSHPEQMFFVALYVRFPGISLVSEASEHPPDQAALDL